MTNIAGVFAQTFLALILLVVAFGACPAQEQSTLLWRAGIRLAPVFLVHSASFKSLPGITQPSNASSFSPSGAPIAIGVSAFAELPLFRWGTIGLLADYRPSVPATFTATELIPVQTESGILTATVAHAIDAQLHYAGGELFAHIFLPGRFGLRVGPRFDVLTGSSFSQTQEITNPDLEFIGFEGKVVSATGALPGATPVLFSLSAGLTYPVDVSNTLQLQLEGGAHIGLTNVMSGVDWTFSSVQAGLSLLYSSLAERQRLADTLFQRDTTLRLVAGLAEERVLLVESDSTVQQTETPSTVLSTTTFRQRYVRELPRPKALLTAGVAIRFVLSNGQEASEVSGEIKTVEEIRHILASERVVYDGLAAGNPLFGMFSREFDEEQKNALGFTAQDMQRSLLQHLAAGVGTLPDISVSSYGGDSIARFAADRVQKLCADAWGKDVETVAVQMRSAANQPAEPVAVISVGSQPEPFIVRDTSVLLPVQQVLFYPEVVSEVGVQRWEIHIRLGERELYAQKGNGDVPSVLSWTPDTEIIVDMPHAPIQCMLTVVDRNGQQQSTSGEILFRHSQSGTLNRVDTTIVRFIVHGRELDRSTVEYIRRQLRQLGAPSVTVVCWFTAATLSDTPVYVLSKEARALLLPSGEPDIHLHVVPGVGLQARRADAIIDIRAKTTSR